MTVEITGYDISEGVVTISAVEAENLMNIERLRDEERELNFVYDTTCRKPLKDLYCWLKSQKATKEANTWKEALSAVVGTVTDMPGRYKGGNEKL